MPTTPPRLLYFDLGNVLLNFDHEIAVRQMAQVSGAAPDVVREIIFGKDGLEWRYERGDISSREFYDLFCQQSKTQPDYNSLHRAGSEIFELNTSVVPIVSQLSAAGNRLGILSNTCEAHWEYAANGRYTILQQCFDLYALSYKLGSIKPEPHIYQAAAELAGVSPQEIFFVDDRPDNVAAACNAGYDAIQFTTATALAIALRERGVRFNY